jgi:hypothetical protein
MCYSAEVSIGTFLFVEAICIFLWMRNRKIDRPISLILSVIVLMQLFEYLLWTNPECNDVNKTITAIIPTYLFLQPTAIATIIFFFNAGWGSLYPLIIVGTLYIALFTPTPPRPQCIQSGECKHLDWNLDTDTHLTSFRLYYASMLYLFATLKNTQFATTSVIFYIGSWFITNQYYNRVWSSVWCHAVNAMSLAAVVL